MYQYAGIDVSLECSSNAKGLTNRGPLQKDWVERLAKPSLSPNQNSAPRDPTLGRRSLSCAKDDGFRIARVDGVNAIKSSTDPTDFVAEPPLGRTLCIACRPQVDTVVWMLARPPADFLCRIVLTKWYYFVEVPAILRDMVFSYLIMICCSLATHLEIALKLHHSPDKPQVINGYSNALFFCLSTHAATSL
jgi:hypothetical protein